MTTCQVSCLSEDSTNSSQYMMPLSNWLSLTDLSRIYGISVMHCGRALEQQGWRDRHGHPTLEALKVNAASTKGPHNTPGVTLWNKEICREILEKTGYEPLSRSLRIEQWAQLLEALEEGSPSINTTAAQMAEELPEELVIEVNDRLALRGCPFRVPGTKKLQSAAL